MRLVCALIFAVILLPPAITFAATPERVEVCAGSSLFNHTPVSPASSPMPAQLPPLDGQAVWHLQQTVGGWLYGVSFADPVNGYVAGDLGVYKTTDGGQNWTHVLNTGDPYWWRGVQAISPQSAFIVGMQMQTMSGVARWTDDGGATWSNDIVIDRDNRLLSVRFIDALHGVAYGYQGLVYVTQNGGRSAHDWTTIAADPEQGWFIGNFTFRPDMNVYVTGINFCHSTDGGYTWSVQHSADGVFDGGCSFPDLLHGWTGGGQISNPVSGWVHRTTDGGATWSGRLLQPPYPIRVVQFFDENFGFAAGGDIYTSAGGIWSTTDGGDTWNLDVDTGAEMEAIDYQPAGLDSADVWCVGHPPGSTGLIYRTRVARRESASVPNAGGSAKVAARAVPNPFTARTQIELDLPRSANPSSAAVVDPSGRLVRMLASRGGLIEWDGRDAAGREVSAGVYLVHLDGAGGRTVRVIRIR